MFTVTLILLFLGNPFSIVSNKEIIGNVKNEKGEALADVNIYCGNIIPIKSEKDGNFKIIIYPNKKNIIYFIKAGYKPIIKVMEYNNDDERLEVKMEEKPEINISKCQNGQIKNSKKIDIFSSNIQINLPNNIETHIKRNGRYSSYTIFNKSNDKATFLSGSSGPGVTHGFPYEDWVVDSTEITIETFIYKNKEGKDSIGLDLKGKFTNGKLWRYINNFEEIISEYHNVTKEEANYFDEIIDGICVIK